MIRQNSLYCDFCPADHIHSIWMQIRVGHAVADLCGSCGWCAYTDPCALGRFTKQKFWNFEKCPIFYCYMDQYKDMLENKFCSNIAPSASTGPPHFSLVNRPTVYEGREQNRFLSWAAKTDETLNRQFSTTLSANKRQKLTFTHFPIQRLLTKPNIIIIGSSLKTAWDAPSWSPTWFSSSQGTWNTDHWHQKHQKAFKRGTSDIFLLKTWN